MRGRQPRASTPRHRRPAIVASFVGLLVVTAVAFATTGAGYFAAEKAKGEIIVGTVTDYRVDETADPAEIVVEVEVENPTRRPVTLDSANVDGIVNGTSVAKGTTVLGETIPAGDSKTITLRMTPFEEHRSAAIAAAENGSMTFGGTMRARIEQYSFEITVTSPDGGEET